MKEVIDIRLPTSWVKKNLGKGYGQVLSSLTTKIVLSTEHPDTIRLRELIARSINKKDFYYSAYIIRKYKEEELENAEIFRLKIKKVFEPAAEQCDDHIYSYENTCPECGSGRIQIKTLQLDVSRLLADKDFARTIAEEWICSKKFFHFVKQKNMTGCEFASILACGGRKEIDKWLQLKIKGKAGRMINLTRFGNDPFDADVVGKNKCSKGHIKGLNILSEVHINKKEWDGSDFAITSDYVGLRSGVLVPFPIIIISQHCYRLLKAAKITGYEVEIAHLD